MTFSIARAWTSRPVHLRSPARQGVVGNRLRVQLAGPLHRAAVHEGLYGHVSDGGLEVSWLRPTEVSWFRPRLRARFVQDESGTSVVGRFALARTIRVLLALATLGVLFALWTLVLGFLRGPGPELVFLGVIFIAGVLLVKVTADYMTSRFSELCDQLEEHLTLVIADPPPSAKPRKHVRLEVDRDAGEFPGDAHRTA